MADLRARREKLDAFEILVVTSIGRDVVAAQTAQEGEGEAIRQLALYYCDGMHSLRAGQQTALADLICRVFLLELNPPFSVRISTFSWHSGIVCPEHRSTSKYEDGEQLAYGWWTPCANAKGLGLACRIAL